MDLGKYLVHSGYLRSGHRLVGDVVGNFGLLCCPLQEVPALQDPKKKGEQTVSMQFKGPTTEKLITDVVGYDVEQLVRLVTK